MPKVNNKSKRKIQKECTFLYFLAYNSHERQTIHFLKYLLLPQQYMVLRELAINDLAEYLPEYTDKKKRNQLKVKLKNPIQKLAKGQLPRENIHRLYKIIRLWASDAIQYHGLCQKTGPHTF